MRKSITLLAILIFILPFSHLVADLVSRDGADNNNKSGWRYYVYNPFSNKTGYIDNKGNLAIEPQFNGLIQMFFRDLGWVEIDGKYGFIDGSGELVIPARFDDANQFFEGMAEVKIDGKSGYINKKGEVVFMLDFWGSEFRDGLAWVRLDKENWGFVDKSGDLVIGPIADDDIDPSIPLSYGLPAQQGGFSEGLLAIEKEEKFGYMNKNGKIVIEPSFDYCSDFHEGLACVEIDGSQGYIDKSGRIVIKPQFDWAMDFSEGLATVRNRVGNSKKWETFIINKKGKILAGPKRGWEWVGKFSGGLAGVSVNSRDGLINRKFEFVIEPTFDSIGAFLGDIAYASCDDLTGYINKKGHWIWISANGRSLTFLFRDTTHTELKKTIQAFEPVTAKEEIEYWMAFPRRWEYRSEKGILLFMRLIDAYFLADCVSSGGVDKKRLAFEAALYSNVATKAGDEAPSATAVLDVYINPGNEAEEALRDFAIYVLSAHPGVVGDRDHNHAWTLEEIKEDKTWNGIHFLKPHKRD
jgi:hypothetical protein